MEFGAYSLAFASNGFHVQSFDISETAVEITKKGLERYGIDATNVKVASILDTGYADESFDGVIAHAVLDHLMVDDTKKALQELFRITKPNGLILVSFDIAEDDDMNEAHITLKDGTMQYTCESRKGMLFHPYDWEKIDELLKNYNIVYKADKGKREHIVLWIAIGIVDYSRVHSFEKPIFVLVQNLLTMVALENMLGLGIPLILKEILCLKMSFLE